MSTSRFVRFSFAAMFYATVVAGLIRAIPAQAQTPTVVYNFTAAGTPQNPYSWAIAQGRDGNLYSSTCATDGGTSVVFNTTPLGTLSTVDSTAPTCSYGVTLGTDGNFYGATSAGGTGGVGEVYKVTPAGVLTVLHSFTGSGDGSAPVAPPIEGTNGIFYGTTTSITVANSTAYSVTSTGVFTTLHTFTGTDGQNVYGQLVQGTDGNFYGVTGSGGTNNDGVIFKMTATGTITVLHNFAGTDGSAAYWGLIQGKDGNFYGTTTTGGTSGAGVIFKITSSGTYTVLYNFTGSASQNLPRSSLVQATNGILYGVTSYLSGPFYFGTIYSVTTSGTFTSLYSFAGNSTEGGQPSSPLRQHTNGLLYGTTYIGGDLSCLSLEYDGENVEAAGCGTVYSLNIGAKAFITLQSTSGKVGAKVGIFGQGFSSSSVVKFNGVAAAKPTLSGTTYLTATVPTGASSGFVTVTTGTSTLTSTAKFTVHDAWSSGTVMPTARFGAFTGAIGSNIYVVGGATNSSYQVTNVNEIYNTTTNKWTTGAPDPTTRELGASAVVNGILYVIGGSTSGSGPLNLVEAYDPVTNTWMTKSPMPTARNSMPAVVDKNIIYVIGGYDPNTQVFYNTVESYNPTTDTWTEEAPLPVGTAWEAVGLLGSTIVAADGQIGPSGTVVGTNEGYNVTTNTWSTLTADPTPRLESCFAAISGDLYVSGGANATEVLGVNEAYNATTKKWTTLTSMPDPLETPGSATVGGRLYCFGGSSSNLSSVYNYVQIYQP